MHRMLGIACALALVAAACGDSAPQDADPEQAAVTTVPTSDIPVEPPAVPAPGETPIVPATREPERLPDRVDPSLLPGIGTPGVVGEVPEAILDSILADATALADASIGDVAVLRGEFVIWNDGSLGCPEPGQFYTQALVDGYWVVLDISGEIFDYRATVEGTFKRCESRLPLNPVG